VLPSLVIYQFTNLVRPHWGIRLAAVAAAAAQQQPDVLLQLDDK
jgi:hypothetical protein